MVYFDVTIAYLPRPSSHGAVATETNLLRESDFGSLLFIGDPEATFPGPCGAGSASGIL